MSTRNIKRVAVLAGGPSKEREVSLVSAGAAARALGALGYDVITNNLSESSVAADA